MVISAKANLRLPAIISSNMVLQQKSGVKIWGWCDPYERVSVTASWDNKICTAVGSRDAGWQVIIETPPAGGPYTIVLKGNNSITLSNVMVGEVWVCSGQSNMEMCGRWGLKDIKEEQPHAGNAGIRFFHIPRTTAPYPQDDCAAAWSVCDSAALEDFSAVGYFFGKGINASLHVPVGLIEASWGGTAAEVWTPDSVVHNDPVLKQAATLIKPSGMCPFNPGYAYNGMIAPVTPYVIAGVVWYQGENNTDAAGTYERLFTRMIGTWRQAWKDDFSFYFVQIAPFRYGRENVGALLREAQTKSMQYPKTGMVVITDLVADTNNVHPADKHDVGKRLADWALAETYHLPGISYKSPFFTGMSIQGGKAAVAFSNAPGGLFKGIPEEGTGWLIAGPDRIFYPAETVISNNKVIVRSDRVPRPVAVRYGFGNTLRGTLFNSQGLPVAPFRTDDWPVDTK